MSSKLGRRGHYRHSYMYLPEYFYFSQPLSPPNIAHEHESAEFSIGEVSAVSFCHFEVLSYLGLPVEASVPSFFSTFACDISKMKLIYFLCVFLSWFIDLF